MSDEPFALPGGEAEAEERIEIEEPRMYRVLIHNDDYTTMEFVVEVIVSVFHKPAAEATKIMLDVHKRGMGSVGVYTYDIALSKIDQVHSLAEQREFPLRCSIEEA